MQQRPSEIVVLKPTTVFLSFLASQLADIDVPSYRTLNTNKTAYVIPKHSSEQGTLNEIQKHFTSMFRHEISRWLGKDARNEIETNFLEFLCCFKFELHSHIILMESSIKDANNVIKIKPRQLLLNWIKSEIENEGGLDDVIEEITLSQITENATLLIKNFTRLQDIKPFLQLYYKPIFETAMSRMSRHRSQWPIVNSYQSFCKYFAMEIHTQLIHLPS